MSQPETTHDISVENHGTIILFRPLSPEANTWFDEHVQCDFTWAGSIPCEPRYAQDIIEGLQAAGFSLNTHLLI